MATPKPCPNCGGIIKKHKAKTCWNCYIKNRPLPKSSFKKGEISGKNHPRWKGGISATYWKKIVLERDNYTCRCTENCWWHLSENMCLFHDERIMEVDHIEPRKINPLKITDIDNMKTYCPNCHRLKTNSQAILTNSHSKKTAHLKHP